jgi:hypothetical protein
LRKRLAGMAVALPMAGARAAGFVVFLLNFRS